MQLQAFLMVEKSNQKRRKGWVIQAGRKSKPVWLILVKTSSFVLETQFICLGCVFVWCLACHVHLPRSGFCALIHAAPSDPKSAFVAAGHMLCLRVVWGWSFEGQRTLMVQFTVNIKEASLEKQDVCVSLVQIKSLFSKVRYWNQGKFSFWNGIVFGIAFCVWANSLITTFKLFKKSHFWYLS